MSPSTLTIAARAFSTHIADELGTDSPIIQIGSPTEVKAQAQKDPTHRYLGLYVYRVEQAGGPGHVRPRDPLMVTLHCLLVPMILKPDNHGIAPGELNLQLLGQVLGALHRKPVIHVLDENEVRFAQVQVIPVPLSLEDMNRLWSTQVGISSRLSAAYELALVPLPPKEPAASDSKVAEIELDLRILPDGSTESRSMGPRPALDGPLQLVLAPAPGQHELVLVHHISTGDQVLAPLLGLGSGSARVRAQRWHKGGGWVTVDPQKQLTLKSDTASGEWSMPLDTSSLPAQYWIWLEQGELGSNGVLVHLGVGGGG